MVRISTEELDQVLAVQLLVAWAGESPGGGHPRLGWWKTDVIDDEAGGDLWKRLLPRTHRWAGLDAARRAAYRTDANLRRVAKDADLQRTLFHFGFEIDEALAERLAHHVLEAHNPADVLPVLRAVQSPFDRATMRKLLSNDSADASFKAVTGGRQLKRVPNESLPDRARRLARVLLSDPLSPTYPLPFVLEDPAIGQR